MEIITLDSIDSTNDFLKDYNKTNELKNFTVVNALEQTNGRGQMGSNWVSESGKNLTFSILIKKIKIKNADLFVLNLIVSNALFSVLNKNYISNISLKWPNDVMIGNKKVAGVLIENLLKTNKEIDCIIGIGLNVNQEIFSHLPQATSLFNETKQTFNLTDLLNQIVTEIEFELRNYSKKNLQNHLNNFNSILYKRETPMTFKDCNNQLFMGIIKNVSLDGKIHILKDDDILYSFTNKEIEYLIPN